jgi:hypothetical protein
MLGLAVYLYYSYNIQRGVSEDDFLVVQIVSVVQAPAESSAAIHVHFMYTYIN